MTPKDVTVLDDDVTNIDTDPEFDAIVRRHLRVPLGHAGLHLGRTAQPIDDAGELDQHAVARSLDDPAMPLGDTRIDHLSPDCLEPLQSPVLVGAD